MSSVVERYLLLGLRLGRHVDGLVDAYYGPAEAAEEVAAEPLTAPSELVDEAASVVAALDADAALEPQRRVWLRDQASALHVYARVLAGEPIAYSDEVEGCYGVRPAHGSVAAYTDAHERLDALLPGDGPLLERYDAWRSANGVAAERKVPTLLALVAVLRERTARLVDLPDGEGLSAEAVRDEPWWAFNYYLGRLRSRIAVNTDPIATPYDLVTLATHECYPGHHTEHAVKEQRLVRDLGRVEEAIQLVPTPQAVVAEGIATTALDVIVDEDLLEELGRLLADHGPEPDLALAHEVERARHVLRGVGVDAALMFHEDGAAVEDVLAYVERWQLRTPEQAAQSVRFLSDPTWRAYAITYTAGRVLCERFVGGDPARFRRLLTEQVRVRDLLDAA